jgi:hypothetical protein
MQLNRIDPSSFLSANTSCSSLSLILFGVCMDFLFGLTVNSKVFKIAANTKDCVRGRKLISFAQKKSYVVKV